MSSLTSWAAELVDRLNNFHTSTNPLDSNFQNAVHDFTNITNKLKGPAGPDAFTGQAADAIRQAISACASRDQAVIDTDVLGQATTTCTTFVQGIDNAIGTASANLPPNSGSTVDEILADMTIAQAAQYGSAAIPPWISRSVEMQVEQVGQHNQSGTAMLNALAAQHALQSLEFMANTISEVASAWGTSLENGLTQYTSIWKDLDLVWKGSEESFEILEQIVDHFVHDKGFQEGFEKISSFLEKDKGSWLASIGFVLTILSDPPKDPNTFMRELYGSGVSWAAGLIPGVGEASLIAEVIHQAGPYLADGQDYLAKQLAQNDPELFKELEEPGTGIQEGAEKIELGSVFNDIGSLLYDGSSLYSNQYGSDASRKAMYGDLDNLRHDSWKALDGTWQFSVNVLGAGLDDVLASNKSTAVVVPYINDGTKWVASLPDKAEHFAGKAIHWVGSLF